MEHTGRIIFRGLPCSEAMVDEISGELHELDRLCPHIVACRAIIQRSSFDSDRVRVAIEVVVPGRVLRVGFDAFDRVESNAPDTAIAVAFAALRQDLEQHLQQRRTTVRSVFPALASFAPRAFA